jgi:hypothetical protein
MMVLITKLYLHIVENLFNLLFVAIDMFILIWRIQLEVIKMT